MAKRKANLRNYRPPGQAILNALWASVAVAALRIAGFLYDQYVLGTDGLAAFLERSAAVQSGISMATLVVGVASIYFWCTWQVRALTNLQALYPKKRDYTPTESLLFYLIPVVSLHRPFEVVMTMFRDCEEQLPDEHWGKEAKFVGLWWGTLWVGIILFGIGYGYAPIDLDRAVRRVTVELQIAHWLWVGAAVMAIVSAITGIRIIRHINQLQVTAADALRATAE